MNGLFRKRIEGLLHEEVSAELARRVLLFLMISTVAMIALTVLGVLSFVEGKPLLGAADLVVAVIIGGNFALSFRTGKLKGHIYFGTAVCGSFLALLFATGGADNTGFLWFYTFPLVATFLNGSRRGAIFTFIAALCPLFVFIYGDSFHLLAVYPINMKVRFLASFTVVAFFAYAFEHYGEMYRAQLRRERDKLEERVKDRTAELSKLNIELQAQMAERTKAEAEVRKVRDYLKKVLDATPESLMVIDTDHNVELANLSARVAAGMGPDSQLEGETKCYRLLHDRDTPCDTANHPCPLATVIKTGERANVEHIHVGPEGNELVAEIHAAPTLGDNGEVVGIVESCRDVTERKLLEKEVAHTQKMQAMGTLSGGIAHEFNNVLASILGFSELARMRIDKPEQVAKDLQHITDASLRARDLVRRILTYTRSASGNESALIDLAGGVTESLGLTRPSLSKSLRIEEHIDGVGRVQLGLTDIHQIVMNLLTNSDHATGGKGRVSIELSQVEINAYAKEVGLPVGTYAILKVSDDGYGMERDTQQRVFEPFFTTKEPGLGTGLGLSIVFGIAQASGGTVTIESVPGKGTQISVYLPITDRRKNERKPDAEHRRGDGERIMVVDDEEGLISFLCDILDQLGYRTSCFTSPEKALEALRSAPGDYDLLLTDYSMPKLSGMELAKLARDVNPDIIMVLHTGYGDTIPKSEIEEAGFAGLLTKPIKMKDLSFAMYNFLKGEEEG